MDYQIKKQIRATPQVGIKPYRQIHAHSTGNPSSTAQNEADYMSRKDLNSGFYTHVVGNGQVIQTANVNQGAWDVGGNWNNETYAAVELIESHKTKEEFLRDYAIYIELLRDLANQAGIPIQIDCSGVGINTHYYCTYNQPGNNSDHVDPYPYLQKWGISKEQFKKDIEQGVAVQKEVLEKKEEKVSVAKMFCLFKYKNAMYFYNGVYTVVLTEGAQVNILKSIYHANNGKDIPEYDWSPNNPTAKMLVSLLKDERKNQLL